MTQIVRTVNVDALHERVIGDVASFFQERSPQLMVSTIGSASAPVEVRYSLVDDWTRLVRRHSAVSFAWRPRFWAFPRFGAMLTVRPHGAGSLLVLEGSYAPPGALIGRLFDRVIGERLANRTMDHLLQEIKEYIEDRQPQTQ